MLVGVYTDSRGVNHGFLDSSGDFIVLTAPGAGAADGQGTWAFAISNSGVVVGQIVDPRSTVHGWALQALQFTELNDPHAGASPGTYQGTYTYNIDEDGNAAVGQYVTASGTTHGYVVRLSG